MEKEFIPYTEALALKELGFDEICPTKYGMTSLKLYGDWKPYRNSDDIYEGKFYCNDLCAAPLYQQAFRWFREKHEIEATTACFYSERLGVSYKEREYHCHIIRDGVTSKGPKYKTYEEAELSCLKKLIEIVKEK
jgi:hypothetical protein